ncbi:MAG: ATP-binding cassette domain-containing protein [Alphaproteobacteria bacterium]|nr:ATP-binding cassette domain-containing protein [Alphaproteobacteria bacterium]
MIDINDITVRIGSKVLLSGASAHISDGQKVGLIGANGCGKSTLFRVLRGELETETGTVVFPSRHKVVFVEQEMKDVSVPILEFVLNKDEERSRLLQSLEKASEEELAEIHERLRIIGASSAEARAAEILVGLGFSPEDFSRPIKEFSGGWRMRLSLAAALFQPSDVLLLDEPTNHLDLEAGIWLENHLQKYRGTLLLISHDRNILNSLCDYIIHFDNQTLVTYSGNYDNFEKTRALQREVLSRQAKKQEMHRKHLQSFVDRFRYKATKAKQAQSRLKMLEKMEMLSPVKDDVSTHFEFPEPEKLSPPFVSIENGVVGYGDKPVLKKLSFRIVDNDRIALLGANGNGKSTLAKLLSGRLPLMSGEIRKTPKLKVGYFAQYQTEELPEEQTAAEYMSSLMPEANETKVRSHLARFGLGQEKALTVIGSLSGGEKARLLFAAITTEAPALLILDEPTNHLDIDARDALVEAVNAYGGSVILITHDIRLIELIADDLWLVKNGLCRPYDGDLDDYKKLLLEEKKPTEKIKEEKPTERKENTYNLKKQLSSQIRKLETEIDKLQKRKNALEQLFSEQLSMEDIVKNNKELKQIQELLEQRENEWLELSGQLENL